MPPVKSGRKLSERQTQLLRHWIAQGAKWQSHWSFITPEHPPLPRVRNTAWPRNCIDYFILDRLEREGLQPSPEADRITLLRRVTLDLTGLPPTPAEVDAFLDDTSPDAYEKVVDRLLASPRFGERMAVPWLDAARYADTNGYQSDGERYMWRWRDWVIEAFNRNMPFDQFTIEQLAGDMLPGATLDQQIASGFNRNHRGNAEGGIIPEEYAVEYVVDRVDTTATVWLGLTMGCARCHDHKFDPITQKEFYRLFAYFNNVPERGKAIKYGNSPPMIQAPTLEQQEQDEGTRPAAGRSGKTVPGISNLASTRPRRRGRNHWIRAQPHRLVDHRGFAGALPVRWLTQTRMACPPSRTGRIGRAGRLRRQTFLRCRRCCGFRLLRQVFLRRLDSSARARGGTILSRMIDVPQAAGYSIRLEDGKIHVNLVVRWLDDAIRVHTERSLPADRWCHVVVTYDGSRVADGIKVYLDGRPEKLAVDLDDLNQNFQSKQPLRIGAGHGPAGRFHGAIDDVRIYDRVLYRRGCRHPGHGRPDPRSSSPYRPDKRTPPASPETTSLFPRYPGTAGHPARPASNTTSCRQQKKQLDRKLSDDDGDARDAECRAIPSS